MYERANAHCEPKRHEAASQTTATPERAHGWALLKRRLT